ncbi:MAG: hypothetical protein VB089_04235, partial [Anaerolineaceae bacterium]|nr:hypothetical protein [Anaerolineaceae bacterium]
PYVLAGNESLVMEVLGRDFRLSAGAFFQVNLGQAENLVRHCLEAAGEVGSGTLLDVYCGVGLFSAFLAGRGRRLVGIESSPAACEDFAANLDAFDDVELYQGAAEEILGQLDLHPDFVVVDPPRAGLARDALDALARMQPQRILYVSCDPSTLGRDAARLLKQGYRLAAVTPFDMFPQTYHIESASLFELSAA